MTPYDSWNEVSQAAWQASRQSYFYDLSILQRNNIPLDKHYKFRSTPNVRETFEIDGRKFKYASNLSTDTFAVFVCEMKHLTAVIFAHRGTDALDPFRFLNTVPETYEKKLAANFMAATNMEYKDWQDERKNPFTSEETIPCSISYAANAASRESVLSETTAEFAQMESIPLMTSSHIKNISKPKNGDMHWQQLIGGRGAPHSDFISDANVGSVFLGSRNLGDIDAKHKAAVDHTSKYVEKFLEAYHKLEVVFTGHSLGGSLAFASFLHAKANFPTLKSWYVGFNAATLSNFEDVLSTLRTKNPQVFTSSGDIVRLDNAIHYRNEGDFISVGSGAGAGGGFGNWVNTLTYSVPVSARGYLWLFKEADTAANIHGHWTFYKCERSLRQVVCPYFNSKRGKFMKDANIPADFKGRR